MHPKMKGDRTEAVVLAELVKAGHVVLMPFGENQRYDLVVDRGDGKFLRIQCKTGRLRNGVVRFNAYSSQPGNNTRKMYTGQIDAFAVYCPDNEGVYFIPIGDVTTMEVALHTRVPKTNGHLKHLMADGYKFSKQVAA